MCQLKYSWICHFIQIQTKSYQGLFYDGTLRTSIHVAHHILNTVNHSSPRHLNMILMGLLKKKPVMQK